MPTTPGISQTAVDQLKKIEGYKSSPYWDYKQWSIGYGSYAGSTDKNKKPTITVTPDTATTMLLKEVQTVLIGLQKIIKSSLTQSQLDALLLFVYNLGIGILTKTSTTYSTTLLQDINNKNFTQFAERMKRYDKVLVNGTYVVNQDLVARRALESNVFTRGWNIIVNNPIASGGTAALLGILFFFFVNTTG